MGGKVNQMPIKGSYQEPQGKKRLHLPVIVQKECWISFSGCTKGRRLQGWGFPFVNYKNVFKLQLVQALCYFSSLFIEKEGLEFKVQN